MMIYVTVQEFIVLTNTQTSGQTKSQTDSTENNTTLARLHCAGGEYYVA